MVKKLEGAGLRGQVAGETSLSTVGQIEGLAYRGHKIETLADKATFEDPHQYAVGINTVLVNGVIVVENGLHNGNRPGRVLRGPGYNL